jgi:hypothetical protein
VGYDWVTVQPKNQTEQAIAQRIDAKAFAIAERLGRWDRDEIMNEMRIATPFEWSQDDSDFFGRYLQWRRDNPIPIPDSPA